MGDIETISKNRITQLIPKRRTDTHKGTYGRVLLIVGSHGMAGAAILCARAALRSGSGLVTVSAPCEIFTAIHAGVPEATCTDRNVDREYDAVAIGPGLGMSDAAAKLVNRVATQQKGALVIDADALNIIARDSIKTGDSEADIIMTPHSGEAARLLDVSRDEIDDDRQAAAKALATKYNAVVVLKGNNTLVASPTGEMLVNKTGNPGMATGGSGDVLTGVITSLLGQGLGTIEAAASGVFIHGTAGDMAASKIGEYGLIASDIIEYLPYALG